MTRYQRGCVAFIVSELPVGTVWEVVPATVEWMTLRIIGPDGAVSECNIPPAAPCSAAPEAMAGGMGQQVLH